MAEDLEKKRKRNALYSLAHPERVRESHKLYRQKHKDILAAKNAKYRQEHSETLVPKEAERSRNRYASNPDYWIDRERNYASKYPERIRARSAAKYNIQLKNKCEICGVTAKHRHHPDYSNPLSVVHVCRSCHKKLHKKEEK